MLFNNKQMHHKMKTITSNNHQLGSYELNKLSLSCFDDRRYNHEDTIISYAYGNYKIQNWNKKNNNASPKLWKNNNFLKFRPFHMSLEPPHRLIFQTLQWWRDLDEFRHLQSKDKLLWQTLLTNFTVKLYRQTLLVIFF